MKKLNKTTKILSLKKETVSNLTSRTIKTEEGSHLTTTRLCWETQTSQVTI
ncbi:hypothetical protein [Pedobacter caeni]|uniref:Uncharacterized protein n=1 Tax=Pedobacter caeni TaxID=288992 RepID=A0A1M5EAR7_9SPHI|nr:hypothetical protein [Pedobacter caeni]SHF76161.1 hypothetical protein SAMN04488522_103569 [Pedobacter caeni]